MDNSEFNYETSFPPIGHPEHHFNKWPEHPWIKTKEGIQSWLSKNDVNYMNNKENYNIHDDLTVSLKKSEVGVINLTNNFLSHIPVQFKSGKFFYVSNNKLTSLVGSPFLVSHIIANDNEITDFKGITKKLNFLQLDRNYINNYIDMPDFSDTFILHIEKNPITSWDGFTKCYNLWWFQPNWCNETSYDLLVQTPKTVGAIIVNNNFESPMIKKSGQNFIDIDWLREEQLKIKIGSINNKIGNSIEENVKKRIVRKI